MSFFSKVANSLKRSSRRNAIRLNPGTPQDGGANQIPGLVEDLDSQLSFSLTHSLPGPPIDLTIPNTADTAAVHAPTPVNESWDPQKAFDVANLPSSALSTIFLLLDEDSLFDLGRTCRSLNDAVFESWFSQHTDYDLSSPKQRIYLDKGAALQAIRFYLRFPLVPDSFTYWVQVTARGLLDVVQQLDNIRAILHRQPNISRVCIRFDEVDSAIGTPEDFAMGYRITQGAWKALLVATLNAALSRGCRDLTVKGGKRIVDCCIDSRGPRRVFIMPPNGSISTPLHCGPGPPEVKDVVKAGTRAPLTIEAPGAPVTTSGSVDGYQEPHEPSVLADLQLESDMLMLPVLLDSTSFLVNSNSSTLTTLTLNLPTTPSEIWARFLSCATLATLRELTISVKSLVVEPAMDIHPDDLLRFLTRHTTIEKVSIYGVYRGTASSTVLRELNLPSLKFFNGPAVYILWLLDLPPDRIPELETVVLTNEYLSEAAHRKTFAYHLFDEVLHSVANSPRISTFGLQLKIEHELKAWLLQHGDPAHSSSRFIKSLREIKRLHLTFSYHIGIDHSTLEAIAQLINTFPAVKHLQLNNFIAPTLEVTPEAYMEGIHNLKMFFGERCRRLQWLKLSFRDAVRIVPCSEIARSPVQCGAQQAEPEQGEAMHLNCIAQIQPGPPE